MSSGPAEGPIARRLFIRDAAKRLARAASEGSRVLNVAKGGLAGEFTVTAPTPGHSTPVAGEQIPAAAPVKQAPAASRCASRTEVEALIDACGLRHLKAEVVSRVRTTIRLAGDDAPANGQWLDLPALATGSRPSGGSGALDGLVAWIDLDRVGPTRGPLGGFPPGNLLAFFLDARPSRPGLIDASTSRVRLLAKRNAEACPAGGEILSDTTGSSRLALAPELTLPRVWSAAVETLDLDADDREAWERLRHRLASAQDTVPPDTVDGDPEIHRLLGYPDERTGDLPLICELASRGIAVGPGAVAFDLGPADVPSAARRWRLLAQLELARAVGTSAWRRVYFWIADEDLQRAELARICAIAR